MLTFHVDRESLDSSVTGILIALLFAVGFALTVLAPLAMYVATMRLP